MKGEKIKTRQARECGQYCRSNPRDGRGLVN